MDPASWALSHQRHYFVFLRPLNRRALSCSFSGGTAKSVFALVPDKRPRIDVVSHRDSPQTIANHRLFRIGGNLCLFGGYRHLLSLFTGFLGLGLWDSVK